MNFKKKLKIATALSVLFTAAPMTGAIQAGAYAGTISQDTQSIQDIQKNTQDISLTQLSQKNNKYSTLIKKYYNSENIVLFEEVFSEMDKSEQKRWLNKIYKEKKAMDKKLDKQRLKEYKAYGITKKGDAYYYNKKLVGILLDHQLGSSVHALNIHPEGIAIKITRKKNGKIKNVSYMTKKEIKRFLGGQFVEQYITTSDSTK